MYSNGVSKTTCTLYVPIGSKEKYAAANQWKDFENIVEKDFDTGVKSLAEQGIHISGGKGQILITTDLDLTHSVTVNVHNMSGALVHSTMISEIQTVLPIATGTYIVRIGNAAEKVIVR